MKKILLLVLIILCIVLGYSFASSKFSGKEKETKVSKNPILKIGLVADSENENELLARALSQAKAANVDFVIGLGDWTSTGTMAELEPVKAAFDRSGLPYYLTAGDHDLWDSRNRGEDALSNYRMVFGSAEQIITRSGMQFVILDNSDIYKGIAPKDWNLLENVKCHPSASLRMTPSLSKGQMSNV